MTNDGTKEYFEKLKMAEEFANGDINLAKQILNGTFNDIIILKGRFKNKEETSFGLFEIFLNKINLSFIKSYELISSVSSVYRHKPFDSWLLFHKNIEKESENITIDLEKTILLNQLTKRFLFEETIKTIIEQIEKNEVQKITNTIEQIIDKIPGIGKLNSIIDYEEITSIVLHEKLKINYN